VGTGSGIVARTVIDQVRGARVVGMDRSIGMLRIARSHGVECTAASAPGLPFEDVRFDCVLSGFLLSHIAARGAALYDMVRVLRAGGRLGMTAWGSTEVEARQVWDEVAGEYAGHDRLDAAYREGVPWEEWLTDAGHVRQALEEAGLRGVEIRREVYPVQVPVADFLTMRENSIKARFLQQALDVAEWERFREAAAAHVRARFGDSIDHTRDVLIALAHRPG
jgi:SAM-dependent methyltransferase